MPKDQQTSRRKKHRNSKLGCATCKRRRVKCMETLPECANCVKHGTRCDYLDYTPEQLEEFKKAKREQQEHAASRRVFSADSETRSLEKLSIGPGNAEAMESETESATTNSRSASLIDTFTKPPLPRGSVGSPSLVYPRLSASSVSSSVTSTASYFQPHISTFENSSVSPKRQDHMSIESSSNFFETLASPDIERPGGSSSRTSSRDSVPALNQSGVTQDFDNLLIEQDHEIIYPVYSFQNSVKNQWESNPTSNLPDEPEIDADLTVEQSLPDDGKDFYDENSFAPRETEKILPKAIKSSRHFEVLCPEDTNFDARLYQYVIDIGPLISQGKASLPQIRELYHLWLGYFIYTAYGSDIMFSCLTNLTTNFLITNVLRGPHAKTLGSVEQIKILQKTLLVHSIQHYATVIKSLSSMLNKNSDPSLASSVSYILSLMSIYDPEATVDSTVCFRDGMFSVLSYTLSICKNKGCTPPLFVPIHMQLASNIVRTVYLPAYNPRFLNEYEVMLGKLGTTIRSVKPHEISNRSTFDFIVEVYNDLWKFCQESIRVHIPAVNNNLANIPFQLDVLFRMFRKWANLGPSRLLTVSRSTDPLEKVLNLFFRLFRKAVYAVVPQVKFCFLRDFDSPLMLDVFSNSCDSSVLYSLDSPDKSCLVPEAYSRVLKDLKLLSAYAIRLITFFDMRTAILYRNLVYNETVRRLYPINNVVDWKDSITNIHDTRKEFQDRIGLQEVCIEQFNTTYISHLHYPRIIEPGSEDQTGGSPSKKKHTPVNLLSLNPSGLLDSDQLPQMSKA